MISQNCVPLPAVIHRNRFRYTQVSKSDAAFIYAQCGYNKIIAYEVFARKVREARVLNGIVLPAKERFPNNEAFGKWAWSCWTLEDAQEKFHALSSKPHKAEVKTTFPLDSNHQLVKLNKIIIQS